jgi:hypothetical protein
VIFFRLDRFARTFLQSVHGAMVSASLRQGMRIVNSKVSLMKIKRLEG